MQFFIDLSPFLLFYVDFYIYLPNYLLILVLFKHPLKSIFEKVVFPIGESLRAIHIEGFDAPYAHHPEPEIVYIHQGSGTRLVGHRIDTFFAGDFVFLGPNIPHWWRPHRSPQFPQNEVATVLQASSEFLSAQIFKMPEFSSLLPWLNSPGNAFVISSAPKELIDKFCFLPFLSGAKRILTFLDVLLELQNWPVERFVDLSSLKHQCQGPISIEMEKIISDIADNLREPLSQNKLAQRLNITPVHFSRRFKQSTGMSYPSFINHLRISQICQELRLSSRAISDCAFDAGYQNLSNFNRAFKNIMGLTPIDYRHKIFNVSP